MLLDPTRESKGETENLQEVVMIIRKRTAVFMFMACCAIGIAFAAKITSDYDKSANFSLYKTYAWGLNNVEPTRQAAGIVIQGAVNYNLQQQGLQQIQDVDSADLIVRYTAVGDRDMNFAPADDPSFAPIGGAPLPTSTIWTPGFAVPTGGRYIKKGTLVIDVFERQRHRLIWSVSASDTVSDKVQKAINEINGIVANMFKQYPSKG